MDSQLRSIPDMDDEQREALARPRMIGRQPEPAVSYTTGEMLALELPDVRWIVPDLLPEGSTVFGGRPKIGKSWFALQLGLAIAAGRPFMGRPAQPAGDVMYLALEDHWRRLKKRIVKTLHSEAPDRMRFWIEWPRLHEGGLEDLNHHLSTLEDPRLLIIDTLARLKPPKERSADNYEHDHAVMSMLTRLASDYACSIMILHHTTKARADDFLDSISGTTGLTGGLDTTMVLERGRGEADGRLSITGRDIEDQELALRFDHESCLWSLLGSVEEYDLSKAKKEILVLFEENVGHPMTPMEVAEMLDKNRSTVRNHMTELQQNGQLKAWGDGLYTLVDPTKRI